MAQEKNLSQLWDDSWNLYCKNFKSISVLGILYALPLIAFSILAYFFAPVWYNTVTDYMAPLDYLFLIIFVVTYLLLSFSIIYLISQKKTADYKKALYYSVSHFGLLFLTYLLLQLTLAGLAVLLIIPGIIFSVYWAFTMVAAISKDLRFMDAMRYSKSVVNHRWWRTVGYWLVFAIVPVLVILLVSVILVFILPVIIIDIISYPFLFIVLSFLLVAQAVMFQEFDKYKLKK